MRSPLPMKVEWPESGRDAGINSPRVLPHHRTCRSASGGFELLHLTVCGKLLSVILWASSLPPYCRIPSYRIEWRALCGHLTIKLSDNDHLLRTARFSPSVSCETSCVIYVLQARYWNILWPLLTSHGKLYSAMVHQILTSSPCVRETSPVKSTSFRLIPTWFTSPVPNSYWASSCLADLPHRYGPYIKFLYVGPDVCLWLPPDSVSRRTPLPSAVHFPLLGRVGDLHPLELCPCWAN